MHHEKIISLECNQLHSRQTVITNADLIGPNLSLHTMGFSRAKSRLHMYVDGICTNSSGALH